jgi:hypothetical protein
MADQANNREAGSETTTQAQTQTTQATAQTQQTTQAQTQAATTQATTTQAAAQTTQQQTTQAAAPTWPEQWRTMLAGSDEKELKRLERIADPGQVWKSFRSLEAKLSSGELKDAATPFPDKGTDEEKAKWRTDNGIPALPAEYLKAVKMPKDAEPVVAQVEKYLLPELHNANASPAAAQAAVNALAKFRADNELAQQERDNKEQAETLAAMRAAWVGPDYTQNMGAVERFVAMFPEKLQPLLRNARLQDGRALFNSPEAMQTMARLSREINPIKTTLPNGANGPKAIDSRIAEIETTMRSDRPKYNADTAMQNELRDLYRAREHMKVRAA